MFLLLLCFGLSRTLVVVHIAPRITDVGLSLGFAAAILAVINMSSIIGGSESAAWPI
jgi:L-cystine uptake protein TcyP (sodium:dicarboxylate symporter family)